MTTYEISVQPDVAGLPPLLDWVERCCAGEGLTGTAARRFQLALEEAVVNVIDHAFAETPPPHLLQLRLDIDAERATAELVDNGRPFDPCRQPPPNCTLPAERRDPGGLGIHLIRHMVDRLDYRRDAGRNRLRLETARSATG